MPPRARRFRSFSSEFLLRSVGLVHSCSVLLRRTRWRPSDRRIGTLPHLVTSGDANRWEQLTSAVARGETVFADSELRQLGLELHVRVELLGNQVDVVPARDL